MSPRESYSDRMTYLLHGSDVVIQASAAARAFGTAQRLAEEDCARVCIVIEELVANLYDHGGLTETDRVELSIGFEPGGMRIVIVDPGKPFDPRLAPPNRERPERGGGAGIDIVRAWARFIDYEVTAESNRLELILPL